MRMEVLILKGTKYVKASKAAKDLGYSSDYVGQLCRGGTVDAHLVGRTWYVNPDTLGAHRIEKKRNARVKAREHARRSIEEAKTLTVKDGDAKSYKNVAIRYEEDHQELIPEVRKVSVSSHMERVHKDTEVMDGPAYTIDNENEKVLFKGTLKVVDAEIEEEFTDTTILSPKIMKARPHTRHMDVRLEPEVASAVDSEPEELRAKPRLSFEERIALKTDIETNEESETTLPDASKSQQLVPEGKGGVLSFWLFSLGIIILGVLSLMPANRLVYSEGVAASNIVNDYVSIKDYINQNKDISDRLGI